MQSNQREFLHDFAMKHNIRNPQDWGKITSRQVKHASGRGLLYKYNSSLYECLKSAFSGNRVL